VPEIRSFRALRFEPDSVGGRASIVTPPWAVVTPCDVMPRKSTCLDPKAIAGLVIDPHERFARRPGAPALL